MRKERKNKLPLRIYIYLSKRYFSHDRCCFIAMQKSTRDAIKRDYELPGAIATLYGNDLSLVERKISDLLMGTG